MPLKRASRGRRKGGKGSSDRIQCTNCGATVPKDKAKKVTSRLNLVEHQLAKELRAQGAYIASPRILKENDFFWAFSFAVGAAQAAFETKQIGLDKIPEKNAIENNGAYIYNLMKFKQV